MATHQCEKMDISVTETWSKLCLDKANPHFSVDVKQLVL